MWRGGALRVIVYAPNIHQGGGKVLLLPIVESLKSNPDVLFILDERLFPVQAWPDIRNLVKVSPTLRARICLEWKLRSWVRGSVKLLCMGNLPPLFADQGKQVLFVQNRYLIDTVSIEHFSWPTRIRIGMERWWLKSRAHRVSRFVVQTETMAVLLKKRLHKNAATLPFTGIFEAGDVQQRETYRYDYIYVASGEPHKNHRSLIKAWIELAGKGFFPKLCLTLDQDRFPEICRWIQQQIEHCGLRVFIIGECQHSDVATLYQCSRALIYPSRFESFGLPLIEAAMLKMPVLASDASYVTDVIRPTDKFDPDSPRSIAEAVQRFAFTPAELLVNLLDVDMFLEQALGGEN